MKQRENGGEINMNENRVDFDGGNKICLFMGFYGFKKT